MLQRTDVGPTPVHEFCGLVFCLFLLLMGSEVSLPKRDRKNCVGFKSKSLGVRLVLKFWICLLTPE